MEAHAPAAGWFEDPHGSGLLRWWDGTQWTEHTAPDPAATPAPAPTPQLAAAPVPTPAPAGALAPAAALPAQREEPAASAASTPSRIGGVPPRALLVAGAALVLLIVLAVVTPRMFETAGSDGAPASASTPSPTGPPLAPAEYATQMQGLGDGLDDEAFESLGDSPTPEQVEQALAPLRQVIERARSINPPAEVAAEHRTLITQLEQILTGVEKLAANPNDEAAGMALFGNMFAIAATTEAIETKLGVKIDADDETGATGAATTATG